MNPNSHLPNNEPYTFRYASHRIMNKYLCGCIISLVLFCVGIPLLIYHSVSRALDAEITYGDLEDVLTIATAYLEENPEWPKSWEELQRTNVPLHSHVGGSPASRREFEEWNIRVYVDFNLTRAEVAEMTTDNFTAIRPIGSCWPPEYHINELLEAARQDDGCTVLQVLTMYLRYNAEWPKTWADLDQIRIPLKSGGFHLASDCLAQWKKRVFIDFTTTRAQVAAMTVENFSAVKPIRAIYGPREQRIQELLDVARQEPEISSKD